MSDTSYHYTTSKQFLRCLTPRIHLVLHLGDGALYAECVVEVVAFCLEEFFRKLSDFVRIVVLARKDVEVDGIREIGVMTGDEGSLDELRHRVARDPLIFAEIDHDRLPEALHADPLAKLVHVLLDFLRVADEIRVAVVKINRGKKPPRVLALIISADRAVVSRCCCEGVNVRTDSHRCCVHF